MRFFDLFALIFYNLSRRKGRVALTAVGVVIGTAAVVLLVALATGLQRNATSQFAGMADLTMINVMPQYDMGGGPAVKVIGGGGGGGGSGQPSQVKLITPATIEEISKLSGIQAIIPRELAAQRRAG